MADKDEKDEEKVDFKAFKAAIEGLPESIQAGMTKALRDVITEDRTSRASQHSDDEDEDEDDDDSSVDLESLNRKEFAAFLMKNVNKAFAKGLKPLSKRLDETAQESTRDRVQREFQEARAKHPDFMEWKDEMASLIKRHPELSAEEVYLLARSKDTEKASKIDEKIAESKKQEVDEDKDKSGKSFGGLTPTSGVKDIKGEKLNPQDAATKAWEETMSGVPEELLGHLQ